MVASFLGSSSSTRLTTSAIANINSTLPTGTYYVTVVALTMEGWQNSSVLTGVATSKIIASAGPTTNNFTLNGGSSAMSAESAGIAVTSATNMLAASVAAVTGAVAYAWYISTVNTPGTETLQAITLINSVTWAVPLAVGNQAASAVIGDHSANPNYAFDGLLTTALNPTNSADVTVLPTGTPGTGTPLTSSGKGSVQEIDDMFIRMWNKFELSPTVLWVNAQELNNITKKVLNGTSAPLLRYEAPADGSGGEYQLTAAGVVQYYYNPFALGTGLRIPIKLHPRVPPGTILGWCENLPIQYQSNEVPNVAEVKTRMDYYEIDWPLVTRQRQVGVYAEECLAVYAPFAMGVLTNIGNG